MSDFIEGLRKEIETREMEFARMLKAANIPPKLAGFYNDLVTLQHAHKLLSGVKTWDKWSTHDVVSVRRATALRAYEPPHRAETNGFVLRTAVRDQIKQFGSKRFRTREMFEALHRKYPDQVGEDKKASVSATLANLNTKGEVHKTVDGQRKIWFQAVTWDD